MRYIYRITAQHWYTRIQICYNTSKREIEASVKELHRKGYHIVSIDRIPR